MTGMHRALATSRPVARVRARPYAEQVAEQFEEWYAVYPRRMGRGKALESYAKAIKAGLATHAELLDGARRYAAENAHRTGPDKKFIKHPATWLNQQCWLDEPDPASMPAAASHRSVRYLVERELLPGRSECFSRHFLAYLLEPAGRLGLAGSDDRAALAAAVAGLFLRVEEERCSAGFEFGDYASLMDNSELVRCYLDWLREQGWHTATLAVLRFDSSAFSQFRRETALTDQFGRDPISRRSRFTGT
jgi:hypothetical protein